MGMNDILKIILVSLILIILTILITLVGIGKIELTFDVNSVFVIAIPIVVTHIIVNSLTLIWSFIFTLWTSYEINPDNNYIRLATQFKLNEKKKNTLILTANYKGIGFILGLCTKRNNEILSYLKIIGIIATLIWMFELGIGFVVNTTTNLDLLFL